MPLRLLSDPGVRTIVVSTKMLMRFGSDYVVAALRRARSWWQ
jgi:hypothetical protein